MNPRRSNVAVGPSRFWWSVTWIDAEMVKRHGRGEMELLFKRRHRADEFARSLMEGATEEVLDRLAATRLT